MRIKKLADQWIDDARSLADLSRLMGGLPARCSDLSTETRSCLWRMDALVFGHGTAAAWIKASPSKKIQFQCRLPKDGSPREKGSCTAEIGS